MNFISINIRGAGNEAKARWVRRMVMERKISFLAIQETQFSDGSKIMTGDFWGNTPFVSEVVDSSGRSGGLMSIWNPKIFSKGNVLKHHFFLVISGKLKGLDKEFHVVNHYGPHLLVDKKSVWNELEGLMALKGGIWIIMGDFNAVHFPDEHLNSSFDPACARDFNEFIYDAGLFEFAIKGSKFTYCRNRGRKLSKIDRILVNQAFIDLWSDACFMALPRYLSDHSPIMLITDPFDFGPIPFRVFNSRLDNKELEDIVKKADIEFTFTGPPDLFLAEKLKWFKDKN
ncbi:uncharacterized protein LOC110913443 [Helianthus annuus]|uniref:uncharacterized protein LOC110913443 n=1 Tax=Helianthus annuus TaxID=4232 RepID=UPI000B8F95BD|nr:uncharacterized protein LOC110913443 [Helianthus annuus]